MKYDRTDRFKNDYRRLTSREKALFAAAVRAINAAADKHQGKGLPRWPANLRIKPVQGARGVWEMTWSFSGPDGRATFEFVDDGSDPVLRWRRVGGHSIFRNP